MDAQQIAVWKAELIENEKHIMMPEPMCVCTICNAKCVREFGKTPNFVTADGVKMPKYNSFYFGNYIYCENCDWKLSQLLMGNKGTWLMVAHEFSEHDVRMWGHYNCEEGYDLVVEMKRLKRNENARLKRLEKKNKTQQ